MGRTLKYARAAQMTCAALLLGGALGLGAAACDGRNADEAAPLTSAQEHELAHRHATGAGEQLAGEVAFYARELTQLDPRSDRAKASRKARQMVDDFVLNPAPADAASNLHLRQKP